jgi:lipoprotein-anchoring transpeptidase ErfK/SrfK
MDNDNIIENPEQLVTEPEQPGNEQVEIIDNVAEELSFWQKLQENKRLFGILRRIFFVFLNAAVVFFIFLLIIYAVPALQEIPSGGRTHLVNSKELRQSAPYRKQIAQMKKDIDHLDIKYNNYTTGQSYVVINTTDNLFYLYKNKKLIRSGHCSTGSYMMLKTEEGRSWVFKTPKGKRTIQGKTTHPYWHRSDWSYIEEGSPVPPKDDPSRYEYGVLGDYSMSVGDGYMIHGTIYKRFLGMPVTHGCVRLNDEDLDVVFHTLNIGSKVYIF